MATQPQQPDKAYGLFKHYIAAQPTTPVPVIGPTPVPTDRQFPPVNTPVGQIQQKPRNKLRRIRLIAMTLSILVTIVLFFSWHMVSQSVTSSAPSPQTLTVLSPNSTVNQIVHATPTLEKSTSNIQVYIVGAVKHPGVYTLPNTSRVYQLLQIAGGPLGNANLIALNLASKLSDGQEIYVAAIGEAPSTPVSSSGSVSTTASPGLSLNINTATADDMRQNLHIGAATAQKIVTYRLENGNFTSVDQLLQVVSKSIYDKIKGQITLS
jgi:competence protein ComEA